METDHRLKRGEIIFPYLFTTGFSHGLKKPVLFIEINYSSNRRSDPENGYIYPET